MNTLIIEITVGNLIYKYFGGHRTRQLAREQAKSLRERGHLAIVRSTSTEHSPWSVYWYDRSSRRQSPRQTDTKEVKMTEHNEYKYEAQFLDEMGEPVGYEAGPDVKTTVERAKKVLTRFLSPYELRYAEILNAETGESISAYRTTPEGVIKQISVDELPE